jgi:hypothetical protein
MEVASTSETSVNFHRLHSGISEKTVIFYVLTFPSSCYFKMRPSSTHTLTHGNYNYCTMYYFEFQRSVASNAESHPTFRQTRQMQSSVWTRTGWVFLKPYRLRQRFPNCGARTTRGAVGRREGRIICMRDTFSLKEICAKDKICTLVGSMLSWHTEILYLPLSSDTGSEL